MRDKARSHARRREQELEHAIAEPFKKEDVSERKREENPVKAKEEEEHAHRAKNTFLAHMSHEIRTPLGGIVGIVDVLLSRIRDEEQKQLLLLLKSSAQDISALIGNILDLSEIESERLEMNCIEFDLPRELEKLVSLFQPGAQKKNLSLSLRIGPDVPRWVNGDVRKVSRILRNLLSNAVKYTSRGEISFHAELVETEPLILRFTVKDTGVGIRRDKQGQLFQSFSRIRSNPNLRKAEGAGLGLAISRSLVEHMGGTLSVESEVGTGSTFSFTIPFETASRQACEEAEEFPSPLTEIAPGHILIAEDNRVNQVFLRMMFEESGHTTEVVENGLQALEAIREKHFDLVLMDIQMPVMDGIEATASIRRLSGSAREIPIIALTAYAMRDDEKRCLSAGMNGYLTKPVDFSELADMMKNVIRKNFTEKQAPNP